MFTDVLTSGENFGLGTFVRKYKLILSFSTVFKNSSNSGGRYVSILLIIVGLIFVVKGFFSHNVDDNYNN